jgi:hypothetical protein
MMSGGVRLVTSLGKLVANWKSSHKKLKDLVSKEQGLDDDQLKIVKKIDDQVEDVVQKLNELGAARASKFSKYWPKASLKETIKRICGDNPIVSKTSTGKLIYKNPKSEMQVVYDKSGNYFRVQNLRAKGRTMYTDIYGKPLPNNVLLIKFTGTTNTGLAKDIWRALTHFKNID